jgi:branched-chain amino acid transport system permease protein
MEIFVQLVLNGLLLGGAYAIISVGLTLIFGVVRVVNFAHGEFLMIGMYGAYLMASFAGWHPYASAIPLAVMLFLIGAAMQRFIIQPLLHADAHIQIFATVGVSTALLNLALLVFGADVRPANATVGTGPFQLGEFTFVSGQVITFAIAIALVGATHVFLKTTHVGRAFRAVAQHRYAASLMGINVNLIYILAFGVGSAFVGIAAALLSTQYPAFPTVGTYFALTAFVIVVLGGLGSMYGALCGAMIIGLVDSLAGFYIAPDLKEVVYFVIFILILVFRPTGLFGAGRGSE